MGYSPTVSTVPYSPTSVSTVPYSLTSLWSMGAQKLNESCKNAARDTRDTRDTRDMCDKLVAPRGIKISQILMTDCQSMGIGQGI